MRLLDCSSIDHSDTELLYFRFCSSPVQAWLMSTRGRNTTVDILNKMRREATHSYPIDLQRLDKISNASRSDVAKAEIECRQCLERVQ